MQMHCILATVLGFRTLLVQGTKDVIFWRGASKEGFPEILMNPLQGGLPMAKAREAGEGAAPHAQNSVDPQHKEDPTLQSRAAAGFRQGHQRPGSDSNDLGCRRESFPPLRLLSGGMSTGPLTTAGCPLYCALCPVLHRILHALHALHWMSLLLGMLGTCGHQVGQSSGQLLQQISAQPVQDSV